MTLRGMAQRASKAGSGLVALDIDHNFIAQQSGKQNALSLVREYHAARWDAQNGGALKEAEDAEAMTRAEAAQAGSDYEAVKAKFDKMEQYEIGSESHDESGNPVRPRALPYKEWPRYTLAMMVTLVVTNIVLLALGAVNVAVIIQGSGIPAFLDNPVLSYLLGGIVPATAMAVKSGIHLIDLDRHQKLYSNAVFVAAGLVALSWIILFALTFEGGSVGIDWDNIGSESGAGDHSMLHTLRNIMQILAEVLIGAALFLVVDRIHAKFSAKSITERTGWREMREHVEGLGHTAAIIVDEHQHASARLAQIKAARTAYILQAVGYL